MTQVSASHDSGFRGSSHICAFYSGESALQDIVVDYLAKGLRAGDKCLCMIDAPAAVEDRIPRELVSKGGMLCVVSEDEAYMPDGNFSKDGFVRGMEIMAQQAAADGYGRLSAVGNESFLVRNSVDIEEWFAAESELNNILPDYPHFFFCLYDLDLFDGETVMYVLRTHPSIYVNGVVLVNPYYVQAEELLG